MSIGTGATLVPEKDGDTTYHSNFRPVSLINVDGKILIKALSQPLDDLLPSIIDPDQVGFIKGRASAEYMKRLIHLIWSYSH